MSRHGFTLQETLIALALLATIAVFGIPKVLMFRENAEKRTAFQETVGMLSTVVYEGQVQGIFDEGSPVEYIFSRVNPVQICQDMADDGCHTVPITINSVGPYNDLMHFPGFVMGSGAAVFVTPNEDIRDNYNGVADFVIDWNGEQPPNEENEDVLILYGGLGKGPYADEDIIACVRPGQVVAQCAQPSLPDDHGSRPLYKWVFEFEPSQPLP